MTKAERPARGATGVGLALAAVVVLAVLATDHLPALRGLPLVLLGLMAGVQMCRELAGALALKSIHPSSLLMGQWAALAFLHVVYLSRSHHYSVAIELVNTVLGALFLLVLASSFTTEARFGSWREGLRDLVISLSMPVVFGLGLGAGAYLQAGAERAPTANGSMLLVAVIAALWLADAAGLLADGWRQPQLRRVSTTWRGLVARCVLSMVLLAVVGLVLGVPNVEVALVAGLAAGVLATAGRWALDRLAQWCEVDRFRTRLPSRIAFLQRAYEAGFEGGMLDYLAGSVLAIPAVAVVFHLMGVFTS